MKKGILIAMVSLLLNQYCSAQNAVGSLPKLSPRTQQYLLETKRAGAVSAPIRDYVYRKTAAGLYMSALIKVTPAILQSDLDALGIKINTRAGNIWTAMIPVNNVEAFILVRGIAYIELDEPVSMNLDAARRTTRVDSVQRGIGLPMGYSGKDVVVGIIDAGFDYTHPTFYDTTGTIYRVKRVWEEKTIGTPPTGFSYGHELRDSSSMMAAHTDDTTFSHGMHVAGIAAGSGFGSSDTSNSQYRGMVYESDIVLVGIMPDSAQWQNTGISDFVDGMNYIYTYAASVGKPAVINLSWGGSGGPHDGSSLFSEACDALTGPGKIFVCAAGNEGDVNLHLQKTFTATDTVVSTFVNFSPYLNTKNIWVDIWGDTAKSFCIKVGLYKGVEVANTGYVCLDNLTHQYALVGLTHDTCFVTVTTSSSEFDMKPRTYISFFSKTTDSICLTVKGADGMVHMWNGYIRAGEGYFGEFTTNRRSWATAGNSDYTSTDQSASLSCISAGAYSARINYKNLNGQLYSYASYTTLGQLVPFSSHGPAVGGRVRPDITAPGLLVVSSLNSFDRLYLPRGGNFTDVVSSYHDPNSGKAFYYGQMSGTSMATPCTSGIIALLLQANPGLNPAQIRNILAQTAILDTFTGVLPASGTNTWGHGKINAYGAVIAAALSAGVGTLPGATIDCKLYPNPNTGKLTIEYNSEKEENLNIEVYDVTGARVYIANKQTTVSTNRIDLDLSMLSSGMYLAKVTTARGAAMVKVAVER
jgi:subtilisin family serine protease